MSRPHKLADELRHNAQAPATARKDAMQVKSIMSQPAVTCPIDGTLDQPARLMWEFDCGIVPVVNDDGRLTGVVTDRDICMAAYFNAKPLFHVPVGSAMAHTVIAVHAEDTVEQAETLMRDNQIRRLPVIDSDGRPVGVVAMNDIARLASRVRRSAVDRELVQTLAAVCEPRTPNKPAAAPVAVRPVIAV
jgi:CBS domain-containing protein